MAWVWKAREMVDSFPSDPLWRCVEISAVRLVTGSRATVRAGGEPLTEAGMAKMGMGGCRRSGMRARWWKSSSGTRC